MVIGQIWTNAPWRAVTAPFRGLMEALRRARRERETYRELSRFSDCMLKDIGISRSEIGSIAQAVGVAKAGMTIAELRSIEAELDERGRLEWEPRPTSLCQRHRYAPARSDRTDSYLAGVEAGLGAG